MPRGWGIRRTKPPGVIKTSISHFSKRWSWEVWGLPSLYTWDQTRRRRSSLETRPRCRTCAASSPTPPSPSSRLRIGWCAKRQRGETSVSSPFLCRASVMEGGAPSPLPLPPARWTCWSFLLHSTPAGQTSRRAPDAVYCNGRVTPVGGGNKTTDA